MTHHQYSSRSNKASNNLAGTIPSEIRALTTLSFFDIFDNNVGGTIPASISELPQLVLFDVEDNNLIGQAFVDVSGLSSLISYRVSFNALTGTIPIETISPNLVELWVAGNQITGVLPPAIGSLTNLGKCLWNFYAVETTPSRFCLTSAYSLPCADFLYIYNNLLTGTLPSELGTLGLQRFQAQNNDFTGTIPENLYFNADLFELRLDGNNLGGTISGRVGDLQGMLDLRLDNNELSGTIPATLSRLSVLRKLNSRGFVSLQNIRIPFPID